MQRLDIIYLISKWTSSICSLKCMNIEKYILTNICISVTISVTVYTLGIQITVAVCDIPGVFFLQKNNVLWRIMVFVIILI